MLMSVTRFQTALLVFASSPKRGGKKGAKICNIKPKAKITEYKLGVNLILDIKQLLYSYSKVIKAQALYLRIIGSNWGCACDDSKSLLSLFHLFILFNLQKEQMTLQCATLIWIFKTYKHGLSNRTFSKTSSVCSVPSTTVLHLLLRCLGNSCHHWVLHLSTRTTEGLTWSLYLSTLNVIFLDKVIHTTF